MSRILVAASQDVLSSICSVLDDHEVLPVATIREADRLLARDGIELFLIGVYFDDSRAIDLVKKIRQDDKYKNTPVVLVRLKHSGLDDYIKVIINSMKKPWSLGDYLEVAEDPRAAEKIKETVRLLIVQPENSVGHA